jgi:hypothetical protein
MPSYRYAVVGAQPQDGIEALVYAFPAYRAQAAALWPELAGMTLRQVAPGGSAAEGEIAVTISDETDDAAALAYHTCNSWGAVQCVVERQQCLKYGVPLTAALTHEVVESGINPFLNRFATMPVGSDPTPRRLPLEVADPVTSGIVWVRGSLGAVACTNLTGPRFWGLAQTGALDLLGQATAPLPQIPRGGAIDLDTGQLVYGDHVPDSRRQYLEGKRGRRWARRNGMAVAGGEHDSGTAGG